MKWFAILGFVLILGVAAAPSITADAKEQEIIEPEFIEDKSEKFVGMVEDIISYNKRNYETSDCGCEKTSSITWDFPIICGFLGLVGWFFSVMGSYGFQSAKNIARSLFDIAFKLGCVWIIP